MPQALKVNDLLKSSMMTNLFTILFLLESETNWIIEIKRLDIDSEDKVQIYFWLKCDKHTLKITRLNFVGMSKNGETEQREFSQGILNFDMYNGTFNQQNYLVKTPFFKDSYITKTITDYLRAI